MDGSDPITQFFPGQDEVDLYGVLLLTGDAKLEEVKKAYRRLALVYHPDKHATASEAMKVDASTKFQQIGFAYAVLSDQKRRDRYDKTGKTDEGFELAAGDDGWEAYFEDMFDRVTRGKLDEMKKEYQGSVEEQEDLKSAYLTTNGDIGKIVTYIPHSTHEDEPRFIIAISELISKGDIVSTLSWESSVRDEQAQLSRKKQGEKEAKEAEAYAKELGVWDEFYGSGKASERKGKAKSNAKKSDAGGHAEEDHSALQALILKKKEKNMDSFFDGLAAKYSEPSKSKGKGRGKKRAHEGEANDESPRKKSQRDVPAPPDIDEEEFQKLQGKLFGEKAKSSDKLKGSKKAKP